jgi:hypothetical protein
MTVPGQPMAVNENEWFQIEPPSTAAAGVLDPVRWRRLNKLLSTTGHLPPRGDHRPVLQRSSDSAPDGRERTRNVSPAWPR